jgi:hypothetical protein
MTDYSKELTTIYTQRFAGREEYPVAFLRVYLALPFAWRLLGKQFLVTAVRRDRPSA